MKKAQKVLIYGPEGVGKTTLAAQFPDPIILDLEGGSHQYDVKRAEGASSWQMFLDQLAHIKKTKPCKTIVIDTADWAEQYLLIPYVVSTIPSSKGYTVKSIEDYGYGAGYKHMKNVWGSQLLNRLQEIVDDGINVVFCSHATIRKFDQPDEMGAYDRWELSLERGVAQLTKEWADMILFLNYETTILTNENKKNKAVGGERMMYTDHRPSYDAKNRHGLPSKMKISFDGLVEIFSENLTEKPKKEEKVEDMEGFTEVRAAEAVKVAQKFGDDIEVPHKALNDLMKANGVTFKEIQDVIHQKEYYPADTPFENLDPGFVDGVLVGAWEQVFDAIKTSRKGFIEI